MTQQSATRSSTSPALEVAGYALHEPDAIATPAMLIYREALAHNLRVLGELAGGMQRVLAHVKTHKSREVTELQLAAGVAGFKTATLRELEMVLAAGAKLAVLAYPLVQEGKLERFAALCEAYPEARVYAIVGKGVHAERLAAVAARRGRQLRVLLDLDVGMGRTGVAPGPEAEALYARVHASEHLLVGGLHAYDGHDRATEPAQREALAAAHIADVKRLRDALLARGLPVELIVGGGSFSFPYYAREEGFFGSPGTCVYWDARYAAAMPEVPFRWAALLLIQVVDHPATAAGALRRFTTDLGNKAVAADPPLAERAALLGVPGARLVGQSEEHGVFEIPDDAILPAVGSYLLAVPGHVCPTTIHYPHSLWVEADGRVSGVNEHTARDRG